MLVRSRTFYSTSREEKYPVARTAERHLLGPGGSCAKGVAGLWSPPKKWRESSRGGVSGRREKVAGCRPGIKAERMGSQAKLCRTLLGVKVVS
ncbi:hypothetical protein TNCT_173731 [Trichonephila clavata]|uniref:Uncharacterized protein n=1 Tax=Trichonephila clavata TaxID=2740835 RepID=A0A8X6HY20_TRICU|nr:hypothetical protein TNCT_173731 [Trichonephila clavata]